MFLIKISFPPRHHSKTDPFKPFIPSTTQSDSQQSATTIFLTFIKDWNEEETSETYVFVRIV